MVENRLEYAPPTLELPSGRCSFGVFVPWAATIAVYAAAIVSGDFEPAWLSDAVSYALLAMFVGAEIVTSALAWRWWRRLHDPAKGGVLVVLALGGLFDGLVVGVNVGLIPI